MLIALLALSAFAIGTTEFVIMGLLPEVAGDLAVRLPDPGWLISGYVLGVAIGAPIMTIVTTRLPRKTCLVLLLMVTFIIANVLCALAYSYGVLMIARVVTALCHGVFFGIGAVVTAGLVPPPPNRGASAVALDVYRSDARQRDWRPRCNLVGATVRLARDVLVRLLYWGRRCWSVCRHSAMPRRPI